MIFAIFHKFKKFNAQLKFTDRENMTVLSSMLLVTSLWHPLRPSTKKRPPAFSHHSIHLALTHLHPEASLTGIKYHLGRLSAGHLRHLCTNQIKYFVL